jgi:hypothetical protein
MTAGPAVSPASATFSVTPLFSAIRRNSVTLRSSSPRLGED